MRPVMEPSHENQEPVTWSSPDRSMDTESNDDGTSKTFRYENHDIDFDEIYTLLANPRRRSVLVYMHDQDGSVDFRELVEFVTSCEREKPPDDINHDEYRTVYSNLYQSHLPRLKKAGALEYTNATGKIQSSRNFELVFEFLNQQPVQQSVVDRLREKVSNISGFLP